MHGAVSVLLRVPSWRAQEQLLQQPALSILFRPTLTVHHVHTIHKITVIPPYTSNQLHKFPLIQDAQIVTRFSICELIFAYTSSFLLQTDCCS